MAQRFLMRVIVSQDDIRKVILTERPGNLEELKSRLNDKLQLQYDYDLQYEDAEFNALCNLTDVTELYDKVTLKIIPVVTLNLTPLTSPVLSSVSDSEADTEILSPPGSPSARQQWPEMFAIPNFSVDVNFRLRQADLAYLKDATLLNPSRDMKHDILEKIAETVYSYKAYPSDKEFDDVAKALIGKHPSLTEPGSQPGWYGWKNSLKFKMANYRTKLRKAGCEDVTVNGGKRSSINPGGEHPSKNIKRPKRGEANYLPNLPEGQTEASLEKIRNDLVEEMKKKKPNGIVIMTKMNETFSTRRREIVRDKPAVRSMVERWPALFIEGEVCGEFLRVASKNLEADFFAGLDQFVPRALQLFKEKKGAIGQKLTELMQDFNHVASEVTAQRALVLKGIPVLLGDKSNEFYKTACRAEIEEVIASVPVGVLSILRETGEYPPVSHAIVLEGSVVMHDIRDLPLAVCLLFGLTYALHLDYPKCMSSTLRFIQSVVLGLGPSTLPPKLLTLKNDLLR